MAKTMVSLCLVTLLLTSGCGDDGAGTDSGPGVDSSTGADTGTGDDAGPVNLSCTTDADCRLYNDCCGCMAVANDAVIAECLGSCTETPCDGAGISDVECKGGQCVFANADCDESTITCRIAAPACAAGTKAHVVDGCYSGLCVPVESCASVTACADCAADQACFTFTDRSGPSFSCSPIPETCGGTVSCECLGDEICAAPYVCTAGGDATSCQCPTC